MKQLELKRMGLTPLSVIELSETDGGKGWFKKLLKRISIAYIASEIISNWDEVKQGFSDGWNFDNAHK